MTDTAIARRDADDVSDAVYASLVDSLYGPVRSALAAYVSAPLIGFACLASGFDAGLALASTVVFLVSCHRTLVLLRYRRDVARGPLPREAASKWEAAFAKGASVFSASLGFLAVAGLATESPTVHMILISVVVSFAAGIAGRNAARRWIVERQMALCLVPLVAGLLWNGAPAYVAFGALISTYFFSFREVSRNLSRMLLDSLRSQEAVESLNSRLEAALSGMSHGMAMFDPGGRFLVGNGLFASMLGIPAPETGSSLSRNVAGLDAPSVGEMARLVEFVEGRHEGTDRSVDLRFADGRSVSLSCRRSRQGCVLIAEDVTERVEAEGRIVRLARFDLVTGLVNRAFFAEAVASSGRDGGASVLCIDLDRFKAVNDTLGHPVGDRLLAEVATRMRRHARPDDVIARFGGDEFVFVTFRSRVDAERLAGDVVSDLSAAYGIGGHRILVGASVGLASEEAGEALDELVKRADTALYGAKADGRGRWRRYDSEMGDEASARARMERDLAEAVTDGAIEVNYQPQVDARDGRIVGFEALARWNHPTLGMVPADRFVRVAEESGRIVEIGAFVLRRACEQAASWPGDLRLAVNLSPLQFGCGDLVADVDRVLRETGFPADRLEMEITETALVRDGANCRRILDALRARGVRIALDDFGRGYSGLSHLHSFPVDVVKVDRTFVTDLGRDRASLPVVRALLTLVEGLGIELLVEGVEERRQVDILLSEGCRLMQGYLFARPMPASRVPGFLRGAVPDVPVRDAA